MHWDLTLLPDGINTKAPGNARFLFPKTAYLGRIGRPMPLTPDRGIILNHKSKNPSEEHDGSE
jgi:hypothetical protein